MFEKLLESTELLCCFFTSIVSSSLSIADTRLAIVRYRHNGTYQPLHQALQVNEFAILTVIKAIQTPKQRLANAKFEKKNVNKWGKPTPKDEKVELPLSKTWIVLLVFLVCGGALLEIVRLLF